MKKIFLFGILLAGMLSAVAMGGEGWIKNPANNHYYRVIEPISWMDAEAQAVEWGGHLVTINDEAEELWLRNQFGTFDRFWIGFNDRAEEGNWVWASGEPVNYTKWCLGEPNDSDGNEDAAVMNSLTVPTRDCWNDLTDWHHHRAIVETIWIRNPANSHYYRVTEPMSWMDAEAQAVEWGGHLVTFNSREEELWVRNTFGENENFWIGFNDLTTEGNWKWVSEEPVTYTNWWLGEPNNQGADGETENAAVMNFGGCEQIDGEWVCYFGDGWNDLHETHAFRAIIETIWKRNPVNKHYYRLTDSMSWAQAEDQAVEWGGHLVTLGSWQEELWIKNTFGENEHLWIGLNDIEEEGTWVWASGKPVAYTNWAEGEPNNWCGYSPQCEDAAVMNWDVCEGEPCYGDYWNDLAADGAQRGVVEKSLLEATIDIKPGSFPNSINLGSNGVIPVAILGLESFDVSLVDASTVVFGPAGTNMAHSNAHLEDVNDDGYTDMILHFRTQETGIQPEDTIACLTGELFDGRSIEGCDSIRIVPPGEEKIVTEQALPEKCILAQNYPNPFNPTTSIAFTLPFSTNWSLKIYNVAGQLVRSYEGMGAAGLNVITWDGKDKAGSDVSSGVYFYKLEAGQRSAIKKMIMLK